jgi:nitroreductase
MHREVRTAVAEPAASVAGGACRHSRRTINGACRTSTTISRAGAARLRAVTDIPDLIRTRRTHKSFGPDPVPTAVVDELLELARWAPNHHRTNPWRFRVLGPETLERLKEAAGPAEAPKLERAQTLVVASAVLIGDLEQDEEDICATASAIYAVLLAAHARGLAGYWRTPAVLRTKAGRDAVGLPDGERFLGLIHLGTPRSDPPPPERAPLEDYRFYLP